jgi:arabinan endo-1,5-alpha-L-arabinosidase
MVALVGAATIGIAGQRRLPALENSATNILEIRAFRVSDFQKIYDPSVGEKEKWYINDHTFIQANDGLWHLFGITHPEPASPLQERFFAHATATNLLGPWTKQASILAVDSSQKETVVWAPYVLEHDGRYWMYYCGGGEDHARYRIQLATSTDLWTWRRCTQNPMVVDGVDARDPMVLRVDDHWVMYYAATSTPQGGFHTVVSVTSRDLIHWSNCKEVFRSRTSGTYGGDTESPFVVHRNGKYYLFVCTNVGYNQTAAYESDSPFHWDLPHQVGQYPAHASEIIHTSDGKWYASRSGWGQGGVYLAELVWME